MKNTPLTNRHYLTRENHRGKGPLKYSGICREKTLVSGDGRVRTASHIN